MKLRIFDKIFIKEMHLWAIPVLRVALAIVFVWFGILKVTGQSPVAGLIAQTYSFFPAAPFLFVLGIWEIAIGLGLYFKISLRVTLALLWLQMFGTLIALLLNPEIFFVHHNPFLLTTDGEFVIKNFVLIAASLVVGGYEID